MAKNKKKTGSEKRFFISLSIKEATGWLTLVLFICGWFFVLGVVVGRWHTPAPARDDALPEKLVAAREKALADPGRTATPDPDETPELLPAGRDDSFASKQRPGKKEEATPANEALEPEIKTKTPRAGKEKAAAEPEVATEPEAAAEPEVAAAAEEAAFTIQIAAVKDEKKARRLLTKLKKNNIPAYVRQARLPDGSVWYRVRCGAFTDRSAADSMMTALRKKDYSPLLVKQ